MYITRHFEASAGRTRAWQSDTHRNSQFGRCEQAGITGVCTGKRRMQQSAQDTSVSEQQAASTWCNPTSAIVRQPRDRVWVGDRPFIWNKIDVGGRMSFLKLEDGSLMVFAPLHYDSAMRATLQKLGDVKHIVSPNFEHVSCAKEWIEAFPNATSYGCPGMKEKEPGIPFDHEIGGEHGVPASWPNEVEVITLLHEANPFNGKPFFNEILLVHKPTKVLLTTDFFWNYPGDVPTLTKLWKFGMDKVYRPFYFNLMIKDKESYKQSMTKLFGLDWDMIVPCHGVIVDQGAKQLLKNFIYQA